MTNNSKKLCDILNVIAMLTYCFMMFYMMANSFAYTLVWPEWWGDSWDFAIKICVIIASIKIYLFFDIERRRAVACLALLAISVIIYHISSVDYIYLIAATTMFFGIEYDKVIRVLVATYSAFLSITLVCALTGIIPNHTQISRDETVYCLGYIEHNGFMLYFYLLVLGAALLVKRLKIIYAIVSIILALILYKFTDSKTSTSMVVLFSLLLIIEELVKHSHGVPRKIFDTFLKLFRGIPIFSFLFLLAGAFFFNKYQRTIFDNTYISRLYFIDMALEESNFPMPYSNYEPTDVVFNLLWGTAGSDKIFPGETLYMVLFIKWGLIALVPCIAFFILGMTRAYKFRDRTFLFVLISLAVLGLSESFHFNVACCGFYCYFLAAHKGKSRQKNYKDRGISKNVEAGYDWI